MWHVSSRTGVATLRTAIHLLLTYLITYLLQIAQIRDMRDEGRKVGWLAVSLCLLSTDTGLSLCGRMSL